MSKVRPETTLDGRENYLMVQSDEILTVVRDVLQDPQFGAGAPLEEARGYDSVTHVQLVIELGQRFGVTIDESEATPTSTVADLQAIIAEKQGA